MDFSSYKPDACSKEELIARIERALQRLNEKELETVYYDLVTKGYIKA